MGTQKAWPNVSITASAQRDITFKRDTSPWGPCQAFRPITANGGSAAWSNMADGPHDKRQLFLREKKHGMGRWQMERVLNSSPSLSLPLSLPLPYIFFHLALVMLAMGRDTMKLHQYWCPEEWKTNNIQLWNSAERCVYPFFRCWGHFELKWLHLTELSLLGRIYERVQKASFCWTESQPLSNILASHISLLRFNLMKGFNIDPCPRTRVALELRHQKRMFKSYERSTFIHNYW